MTTSATVPMTIEQFHQAGLPENYELHGGEPVEMANPSSVHREVQRNSERLFEKLFPDAQVRIEMTFAIAATNDDRSADVGVTTTDRWQAALRQGALDGAPEIVVEVLSPSNNTIKLMEYQRLCFDHGTLVFLIVNLYDRTVVVLQKSTRPWEPWSVDESFVIAIWGQTHTIPVHDFFISLPEKLPV